MKTLVPSFVVWTLAWSGTLACKSPARDREVGLAKMAELTDEMCRCQDARCAQRVSDRMMRWSQEQAKGHDERPASADQSRRAAELGERMAACMQTAMGGSGAAAASAAAEPVEELGPDGLPIECAQYRAAVEKLAKCDKIASAAREALQKAFDDSAAGWERLSPDAKRGLVRSCASGRDAVSSTAASVCGW